MNGEIRIRKTVFNDLFPERSIEVEYEQTAEEFYTEMHQLECWYDDTMGWYYTPDLAVGYEIIKW